MKYDHIYTSSNGDTWHLIRDPQSGSAVVRHQANLSSGGKVTESDVDTFLAKRGLGPNSPPCGVCSIRRNGGLINMR